MIEFINSSTEIPYLIFKEKYDEAIINGQKNIEAMSLSSYDKFKNEVDSRFVNLKFINKSNFIFFSNYKSPKSIAFDSHNQICALIYWSSINTQIRIKAKIRRTSVDFNDSYFKTRSQNKNALAISSNQSSTISDFKYVIKKYENIKNNHDLLKCPDYWGGFSFKPYSMEFWVGHDYRLNKRNLYLKKDNTWEHSILEP